jgi:hypothetical protein
MIAKKWEQMTGEPSKWFERFQIFLSLPSGDRTIKAAFELYMRQKGQPMNSSWQTWYKPATGFQWKERAEAYDRAKDEIAEQQEREQHVLDIKNLKLDTDNIGKGLVQASTILLVKVIDFVRDDNNFKDLTIQDVPAMLRTVAQVSDIGLKTLAEGLGIKEIMQGMGLDKVKETLDKDYKDSLQALNVIPLRKSGTDKK